MPPEPGVAFSTIMTAIGTLVTAIASGVLAWYAIKAGEQARDERQVRVTSARTAIAYHAYSLRRAVHQWIGDPPDQNHFEEWVRTHRVGILFQDAEPHVRQLVEHSAVLPLEEAVRVRDTTVRFFRATDRTLLARAPSNLAPSMGVVLQQEADAFEEFQDLLKGLTQLIYPDMLATEARLLESRPVEGLSERIARQAVTGPQADDKST